MQIHITLLSSDSSLSLNRIRSSSLLPVHDQYITFIFNGETYRMTYVVEAEYQTNRINRTIQYKIR